MATSDDLNALIAQVVRAAGTGRPPLAQAVWAGMSVECGPCFGYGRAGQYAEYICAPCHGAGRVPLTIPEAWPEQWARDAVCGGVTGVLLALPDWIVDTQPKVADAYVLVGERDAPGALRALEAALREETGKQ